MYVLYKGSWIDKENITKSKKLTKEQCSDLLKKGGVFVRSVYNFDCQRKTNFWYVIKDSFGGFDELSSKKRNQVRKSLKTYDFTLVSKEELARIGLGIANKALQSYNVKFKPKLFTQDEFETSLDNDRLTDYWLVTEKETSKPVAYAICTIYEEYCDYSTLKADPAFLNNTYPYYGLIYEMNRYYLNEKGCKFVCDGARSLTEHSNIQKFLIDTFHFRKAYCDLYIQYKWWLGISVKMIYPFRNIIKNSQVGALLLQEAMVRGEY